MPPSTHVRCCAAAYDAYGAYGAFDAYGAYGAYQGTSGLVLKDNTLYGILVL
jgi:hypothetical protein